jgi:hypothetical protein
MTSSGAVVALSSTSPAVVTVDSCSASVGVRPVVGFRVMSLPLTVPTCAGEARSAPAFATLGSPFS